MEWASVTWEGEWEEEEEEEAVRYERLYYQSVCITPDSGSLRD